MRALVLALALLPGAAAAQEALADPRPLTRPEARQLPDAPGRPLARPSPVSVAADEAAPAVVNPVVNPVVSPVVSPAESRAAGPARLRPVARQVAGAEAAPISVAVVSTSSAPTAIAAMTPIERAEALLGRPLLRLNADAWDGAEVPTRPTYVALAAVQPLVRAPLRPALRPHRPYAAVVQSPENLPLEEGDAADPGFSEYAVSFALRPPERPAGITQRAEQVRAERARGAICGSPDLQGDSLGRVNGAGRCGVENAVRVRSVAGVRLSTPATMDCNTARSLLGWVRNGAIPAVGNTGGGLASMRIVSHYACRGRNSQAGARLSEHAFGRAIDIAGFRLRDGSEITVLRGWNSGHGERLRRMWRAACGRFGTVLGPNANRFHRDHFHFDTAQYRSGSYCR